MILLKEGFHTQLAKVLWHVQLESVDTEPFEENEVQIGKKYVDKIFDLLG